MQCTVPCFYYDAMLLLRCHAFTTMPYFLLVYQPIYYLRLTYLLRLQPQSSLPNHKSHLRKNLNICLLDQRNNLNIIKGKGRDYLTFYFRDTKLLTISKNYELRDV